MYFLIARQSGHLIKLWKESSPLNLTVTDPFWRMECNVSRKGEPFKPTRSQVAAGSCIHGPSYVMRQSSVSSTRVHRCGRRTMVVGGKREGVVSMAIRNLISFPTCQFQNRAAQLRWETLEVDDHFCTINTASDLPVGRARLPRLLRNRYVDAVE